MGSWPGATKGVASTVTISLVTNTFCSCPTGVWRQAGRASLMMRAARFILKQRPIRLLFYVGCRIFSQFLSIQQERYDPMLICHCPTQHAGKQKRAVCLRGHSVQVCVEPGCLNDAAICPMPGCKSPVALLPRPIDQPLPLSMSL
jgi:hypothetical protein